MMSRTMFRPGGAISLKTIKNQYSWARIYTGNDISSAANTNPISAAKRIFVFPHRLFHHRITDMKA